MLLFRGFLTAIALLCAGKVHAQTTNVIVPGSAWTDTSGNSIQAHGAGTLKVRFCNVL